MEDAALPLAHREVEAEGVHEPTVRPPAIGRWDSDLVWPASINRGGGQLAFPPTHGPSPLTLCSPYVLMAPLRSPDVNALERSEKSNAATTALLDAEVDEAIASCGGDVRKALRTTLIANAYLEAEIERLTEAISTGFARGRMRRAPQRGKRI